MTTSNSYGMYLFIDQIQKKNADTVWNSCMYNSAENSRKLLTKKNQVNMDLCYKLFHGIECVITRYLQIYIIYEI